MTGCVVLHGILAFIYKSNDCFKCAFECCSVKYKSVKASDGLFLGFGDREHELSTIFILAALRDFPRFWLFRVNEGDRLG
ncbi:Unannotated [Lentimonas sp. CC4]|nr:Unannotated [Lentimonas sp. CC4]CAA6687010.1 Unannotated [Lentimonas sp. CC6]CAA7075853.1 Unannotated [Lentimonas sp. CC4]CAA7172021.1 Unannotated [Lentimonas sp. CC21]CAA7182916.1 Unannotated [Lentimonas sp. CC8]